MGRKRVRKKWTACFLLVGVHQRRNMQGVRALGCSELYPGRQRHTLEYLARLRRNFSRANAGRCFRPLDNTVPGRDGKKGFRPVKLKDDPLSARTEGVEAVNVLGTRENNETDRACFGRKRVGIRVAKDRRRDREQGPNL